MAEPRILVRSQRYIENRIGGFGKFFLINLHGERTCAIHTFRCFFQLSVAAVAPVGGRNFIYSRFYRHSFLVAIDELDSTSLVKIFSSITDWHFSKGFGDKVVVVGKVININ